MLKIAQSIHDLPRMKIVPGHHNPAPFVLTKEMFGGLPIEIAGAKITDLIGLPVAELHVHDIPEIYLLVSPICLSNGALIAKGAGHVGVRSMLPVEQEVVKDLAFKKVADIGCGDGSRLIRLLRKNPDAAAIGIDINADACRYAREMVEKAGFNDRVQVVKGDILQSLDAPELRGVDLVCCFLMMHDLFAAAENPTSAILALRNAFPDATNFLFADTVRQDWDTPGKLPIFSLQFELVHALTNTSLHSLQFYKETFEKSGLHLKQIYPFGCALNLAVPPECARVACHPKMQGS